MRELEEELGFSCPHPVQAPVMVTCTPTTGLTAGHIDVSLWYVVLASQKQPLKYDNSEFSGVRWFPFFDIPFERADPHMGRFIAKLKTNLSIARTSAGKPGAASYLKG
jgi:8-oxo-dGTP pyrophosphatase MutT (NUDIX family)